MGPLLNLSGVGGPDDIKLEIWFGSYLCGGWARGLRAESRGARSAPRLLVMDELNFHRRIVVV